MLSPVRGRVRLVAGLDLVGAHEAEAAIYVILTVVFYFIIGVFG